MDQIQFPSEYWHPSEQLALVFFMGSALAQSQARIGTLSCDVSAGIGFILIQKQSLACVFTPDGGGPSIRYKGQITEYGVALGAIDKGHLIWAVVAATRGIPPGALAGDYAGVGAEATAGAGLGANVLELAVPVEHSRYSLFPLKGRSASILLPG